MTAKVAADMDEYISGLPTENARAMMTRIREIIHEEVPEATETISYGMPTFQLQKKFFWFAAFKKHCSVFGQPMEPFAEELQNYKTSKGTIQFPLDKPLPEDFIRALVRAQIKAMFTP